MSHIQNYISRHPIGGKIDTDGVPVGEIYQCVDVAKSYMQEEFGVPLGAFGNAIDYWNKTSAPILAKFDRVPTQNPQVDDIVVFNGLAGNRNGHIGVCSNGIVAGAVPVLEQNGSDGKGNGTGGNALRIRYITTSRIAGVLRPRGAVVVASAPVAAAASGGQQMIRITGDYRTFYASPGGAVITKLLPALGGGHLDYRVLDRSGDYVKIERQDGSGSGWIYIGTQGGANTLTQFFSA